MAMREAVFVGCRSPDGNAMDNPNARRADGEMHFLVIS
jgi:hypothetical protein